ncbi:protein yellow-like [Cloeon dipterum]|uniref:protein yellow-like n=1 Tax=Cloeon dipterum TaxID=197152 RepID=UPI0032201461
MTPFFVAIFLLGVSSLATGVNFTQVFEWPEAWDYEWPSEESRAQALRDGTFKPEEFNPRHMAVYGTRIFISLSKEFGDVPVTLVTLPTSSASSAPPKLTPFPSWDMHLNGSENCDKIQTAVGLQVDSVGRLWLLDEGNETCNCSAKLWIFDLNNNTTELIHRFPFHFYIHDLVIDETANGTFAYIARWMVSHFVVFSLERKQSWFVDTSGIDVSSIALSPKDQEPRQLYIGELHSNQLHSISVTVLRNGTRTAKPKLIGNWSGQSAYRMVMDNHGTLHAAFMFENFMSAWNTSHSFQEQRFYQLAALKSAWPFIFSLDQNGTFWMTVFDDSRIPRSWKYNAAVDAKSYIFPRLLRYVSQG